MKKIFLLGALSSLSLIINPQSALADVVDCPNALFTAKHCETQRISIGGLVTANYQWVGLDDSTTGPFLVTENFDFGSHTDPNDFNNFYMKNIRLFVRANLCDDWTAFVSIDFAGRESTQFAPQILTPIIRGVRTRNAQALGAGASVIESSNSECRSRSPVFVDRAYIQKQWCDTIFRAGYQKVQFGAEEVIPDEYLKTIDRSIATHFFMHLGQRAVAGQYIPGIRNVKFGGNRFADRHVGLYLQGRVCNDFLYNLAVVNGYQGLCRNSTAFNNELGYFASIAYETCVCDTDLMIGLNAGFKPDGGNWTQEPLDPCGIGIQPSISKSNAVWALNPYALGNWNCLTVLFEMFVGSVQNGKMTDSFKRAHPWGINLIPSYMLNECWELVGRLSYLNTNDMGTSIQNSFGPAPDDGYTANTSVEFSPVNNTFISSEVQFQKAVSLFAGINYYMVNQAVKLSLSYEWVRFKNSFQGVQSTAATYPQCNEAPFFTGSFLNNHAVVQAVRAQIQLTF